MATNYTNLLGFALPTTGELPNTWGSVVNNSITQLVEDAVAGVATDSVTAGDWTLTTTGMGAANQARCAILIATGSPGVTRNIIAPNKSKAYIVVNESNASVVIKGAATTGVTIPLASKALVAWNGTDFVQVGASAGGSNTQVQYNASGALAGSANLTFDGTNLTAAGLRGSTLTSGRVAIVGAGGTIGDSSGLTYNPGTGALSSTTYTGSLKAYTEEVTTASIATTTYDIDLSLSNIFDITLGNNVTFTFTNPPAPGISRSVTVILRQDGVGNRTATFNNANYSDGLPPTLSTGANDIDVLTFFTVNGGSFWFGTFAMANVS
jgi:hypothetical protein